MQGIIIKGVGGLYTVALQTGAAGATDMGNGEKINCNARGLFRKLELTPLIGDKVVVEESTITEILPRKNELRRPRVANVDQVIIVCAAAEPALSVLLINRYLVQAEYEEIPAVICVNKVELAVGGVPSSVLEGVRALYESVGYPVVLVSAQTGVGMEKLARACAGKTTVLAGQSGVGKSSIINLLADGAMEVGALSKKIGRGRHTTRHAQILPLSGDYSPGSYIIDTPGFSSVELPELPVSERAALMREFAPFIGECKFSNCMHNKETGCAIKAQVGKNIDVGRYNWYLEWINLG